MVMADPSDPGHGKNIHGRTDNEIDAFFVVPSYPIQKSKGFM